MFLPGSVICFLSISIPFDEINSAKWPLVMDPNNLSPDPILVGILILVCQDF